MTFLEQLYAALPPASELPSGTYDGLAWPQPPFKFWAGKVFRGSSVVNRIAGKEAIEGKVFLSTGWVEIYYPDLGLTDYLKPVGCHAWLGWTQPRRTKVWFFLSKVQP